MVVCFSSGSTYPVFLDTCDKVRIVLDLLQQLPLLLRIRSFSTPKELYNVISPELVVVHPGEVLIDSAEGLAQGMSSFCHCVWNFSQPDWQQLLWQMKGLGSITRHCVYEYRNDMRTRHEHIRRQVDPSSSS